MKDKIPYELLARYFTGGCSEEEIQRIERWREQNASNEKAFAEFSTIWEHSGSGNQNFNPDAAEALAKVNSKLEQLEDHSEANTGQRSMLFYISRIAAILILALIVWYGYNKFSHNETWIAEATGEKETKELVLPDGTRVTLNTNSTLKYPEKFGKTSRNVELVGEAYFEVAKNPEKPFLISAQNTLTRVVGTAFNLRAIPNEEEVVLTVEEGKVAFSSGEDENKKTVNLAAGDRGIMNKVTQSLTESKNEDTNFMAWKTKRLSFKNTPLIKVAEDLSRYYQVKFEIENPRYDSVEVSIDFDNYTIDQIIEALSFTGIQITKKEDTYYMEKNL